MGEEKRWPLQHPAPPPASTQTGARAPLGVHQGTASGIEHSHSWRGQGLQPAWRDPTPLPVWTFEITYCCYFFSPLTLGQRSPRLCPASTSLVALGMHTALTSTPSHQAALSPPCSPAPHTLRPWLIFIHWYNRILVLLGTGIASPLSPSLHPSCPGEGLLRVTQPSLAEG